MPKKKKTKTQNTAAIFIAGFVIVLFVAVPLAAPLLTKDEKADQQAQVDKYLEELKNQQAQAETSAPPKEIDETLKQEGEITAMQIIDLVTGTGQEAKLGDKITVKYKGALAADGSVFDSNTEGVEFGLNQGSLIDGWIEGIPGMKVGGKRKLVIPSEKGYGPEGSGESIPPNAALVFEVELVSIAQ